MEYIDRDGMEELLYAIQNAAHIELHLLELQEKNSSKGDLSEYIEKSRSIRRDLMFKLCDMFDDNNVGAIWCTLKHALLLHLHLLELYQKDYDKFYIDKAKDTYLMINDLLKLKYTNYSNCARCENDKERLINES